MPSLVGKDTTLKRDNKNKLKSVICLKQMITKEIQHDKTGVINDPLGQTHSHASSEHCFLLFCFSRFESGDVRTDNMSENNVPYRP